METVIRALVIYLFLMLVFRIAGQRSIAKITTFDFVLLLVIGEATQNALLGQDYSMTSAFIAILTLVGLDIVLSLVKRRWKWADRVLDSTPVVIVDDGKPLRDRMAKERVDESEIMTAARETHGLARMEDIRYAVLERNGAISIVPRSRR